MSRPKRHRKGGRVTPKGTRPHLSSVGPSGFPPPDRPGEPDLFTDVRRALQAGEPLDLLAYASSLVAAVDPRLRSPLERSSRTPSSGPSLSDLADTFVEVDTRETTALLAVFHELTTDEVLRHRIEGELAQRAWSLPEWLVRLGDATTDRAIEMVHVLGDGDNVMFAVHLPSGHELAVVVYIDHNVGTLVKDAFVVPDTLHHLEALMRTTVEGPGTEWRSIDLADAKARVLAAIERSDMTWPPFETDTWPACRPLVEWAIRELPDGGSSYVRPEWSDADRQQLVDRFFASPFGALLDDVDHRSLLDSVLWFACDYGPGDPLRWSGVAVELLLEWMPRKVMAPADFLALLPELLDAYVRYCHAERGIPAELTDETLDALDAYTHGYLRAIHADSGDPKDALREALLSFDPDGPMSPELIEALLTFTGLTDVLADEVGGPEALAALDDRPLPDEPFDWTDIPDDVHDRVAEVLALCDDGCDVLFDTEFRTACRRFLARVASSDPAVFRRKGRPETAAAAVCWIMAKNNDVFRLWGMGLEVKDLLAHFGVTGSVTQRAATLLRAAGLPLPDMGELELGSIDYLVSARRRQIIDDRDALAELHELDDLD